MTSLPKDQLIPRKWYETTRACIVFSLLVVLQFILSLAMFTTMIATHTHLLFLCGGAEFIVVVFLFAITFIGNIVAMYSLVKTLLIGLKIDKINHMLRVEDLQSYQHVQNLHMELMNEQQRNLTRPEIASVVLRGIVIVLSVIATIALVIIAIIYLSITQPALPRHSGKIDIPSSGLSAPVTVERERSGMIHIIGKTKRDVAFAQGYVSAQERLWQMEFNRRVARGTLSEIVGKAALSIDKFARTMGFAELVDTDVANNIFLPSTIEISQRFVDGVNAYIKSRAPNRLAPEFGIFNYKPEPFKVADVMLWAKILSYDLSTNLKFELSRYKLLRSGLSVKRVEELMSAYPLDRISILSKSELNLTSTNEDDNILEDRYNDNSAAFVPKDDLKSSSSGKVEGNSFFDFKTEYSNMFKEMFDINFQNPFASNNWVVSGSLMENGKGLCANDPHLSLTSPGVWILMHVKTTDEEENWDAIGAALPSIPNIILGRNQNICWGATNSMPDVQDLYVIDEQDKKYLYNGVLTDIIEKEEVIRVKGQKPVTYIVRKTVYGPIVNDIFEDLGKDKPVALKWTSLLPGDTTVDVITHVQEAHNWTSFRDVFRRHKSPTQNFVYADDRGNIGYLAPGLVPIRKTGHSGMFPVLGNGSWDWQGFADFDQLPQVYNPAKGYIVTANNRVQPAGFPYNFARDFSTSYRAQRIDDLIAALKSEKPGRVTLDEMKTIQLDTKSLVFEDMKHIFTKLEGHVSGKYDKWRRRLVSWDGHVSIGSEEATIFESFRAQLPLLLENEIGWKYSNDPYFVILLREAAAKESFDLIVPIFKKSINNVIKSNGNIPKWGQDVHALHADHPILGKSAIKCIANRWAYLPGGTTTVDNAPPKNSRNFEFSAGVSYRELVNFGEEDQFMIPVGQSGNFFSYYYDNLLIPFSKGLFLKMKLHGYYAYRTATLE